MTHRRRAARYVAPVTPIDLEPTPITVAILLAAGAGTRYRASVERRRVESPNHPGLAPARLDHTLDHKLVALLNGIPLYRHALDHVLAAAVGPVVVVTGAVPLDLPPQVIHVDNPDWSLGQAGSLHTGLQVARELGAGQVIVGLADQPGIPTEAWRLVAGAPPTWSIVVASYDGRRGPNPVRLLRSTWHELATTGDEGARPLMRQRPDLVHEVPCPGNATDIDTLEDLQRWTSS